MVSTVRLSMTTSAADTTKYAIFMLVNTCILLKMHAWRWAADPHVSAYLVASNASCCTLVWKVNEAEVSVSGDCAAACCAGLPVGVRFDSRGKKCSAAVACSLQPAAAHVGQTETNLEVSKAQDLTHKRLLRRG
jgi:hypothetical protein